MGADILPASFRVYRRLPPRLHPLGPEHRAWHSGLPGGRTGGSAGLVQCGIRKRIQERFRLPVFVPSAQAPHFWPLDAQRFTPQG